VNWSEFFIFVFIDDRQRIMAKNLSETKLETCSESIFIGHFVEPVSNNFGTHT
jgi:zona occludens toxin (predicted ATPase)